MLPCAVAASLECPSDALLVGHVRAECESPGRRHTGERRVGTSDAGNGPSLVRQQVDDSLAEIARAKDDGAPVWAFARAHRCSRSIEGCRRSDPIRLRHAAGVPDLARLCKHLQDQPPRSRSRDGPTRYPLHRPVGRPSPRRSRGRPRRVGLRRRRARVLGRPFRGRRRARRPGLRQGAEGVARGARARLLGARGPSRRPGGRRSDRRAAPGDPSARGLG